MPFALEPMRFDDIPEVVEIEKVCFSTPWPASAYKRELKNPKSTRYVIVRHYKGEIVPPPASPPNSGNGLLDNIMKFLNPVEEGIAPATANPNPVVGYAGLWMMMDEAHITTVGVEPSYRGRHLGELLLIGLIDMAMQLGSSWLTLEVRVSNVVAQNLYKKYSFREAGVRKKYYTDNNEDAYIMWSDEITKMTFRANYFRLKKELLDRLAREGEITPVDDIEQPVIIVEFPPEEATDASNGLT